MKNFVPFMDSNLLAMAIEIGLTLGHDIVVTTDAHDLAHDSYIAASNNCDVIASKRGAVTIHERPAELCHDTALAWDTWRDAATDQGNYDIHLYLEPTSPCRTVQDIQDIIKLFWKEELNSLYTVSESPTHPDKIFKIPSSVVYSDAFYNNQPRQLYPDKYFVKNGICYACSDIRMGNADTMLDFDSYSYLINRPVVNIDREVDFVFAKALLENDS